MALSDWLTFLLVFSLGAMSPGPSLAIVIQIATKKNRLEAFKAAIGHGLGVGCYATLAVLGLIVVITQTPWLFNGLKIAGAIFLAFLGVKALLESMPAKGEDNPDAKSISDTNSFTIGFLTSLLNPHVTLFFLALFSQFVHSGFSLVEKVLIVVFTISIDALWYCLMALAATQPIITRRLIGKTPFVKRAFGVLLILIAVKVMVI